MNKLTEEEKNRLVSLIANHIIDTKDSTRKAAIKFGVSNYTVSVYMNKYLKDINYGKYVLVKEIFKAKMPKSIEDEEVYNRVLKVYDLLISGLTVEKIANILNISIYVVQEDLQTRLGKISKDMERIAKEILHNNSIKELQIGNDNYLTQERDSNGRFKK